MTFLPPILLHYYITERCYCRCSFCDIWKIPANNTYDAKIDDVLQNLRNARRLGVQFVDFTGGEPLLHNELPVMLREAKSLGYKTSITTNCLQYEKRAEEVAGLVDFLHFSLDGLTAQKHDAVRGQRAFTYVMTSLDRARELEETPDLLFTVNRDNIDHFEPLVEFAQRLGLMLIVNPVFAYGEFDQSDVPVLRQIERFAAAPFVYVNKAFHLLRRRGGNDIRTPRCRVMDSTIVISPDNRVVLPCYHFQHEKLVYKVIASHNVTKRSLVRELFRSAESASVAPILRNDVEFIRSTSTWQYYKKNQGRFNFCQGCHLNCYFDPSFQYKIDEYFFLSMLAKSRYWWDKNIRRTFMRKKIDNRPAMEIAVDIMKKYDRI